MVIVLDNSPLFPQSFGLGCTCKLEQRTYCDADGLNDGAEERGDVVFGRRVGAAVDELKADTEADDGVVAEQRGEHGEDGRHGALEAEARALEEAVDGQRQHEHRCTRASCAVITDVDSVRLDGCAAAASARGGVVVMRHTATDR